MLAGAIVTYGGVSLFVAFFVLAPMARALFRDAAIPLRLMPAAIVLGTSTFTMSALPGTPAIQNAIPMPFFGTTPFAAPGLGIIASAIMLGFGLWWLGRAEAARPPLAGEGVGASTANAWCTMRRKTNMCANALRSLTNLIRQNFIGATAATFAASDRLGGVAADRRRGRQLSDVDIRLAKRSTLLSWPNLGGAARLFRPSGASGP